MGTIWPWIGREKEASRVRRALHSDAGAVIVTGGPESGKTRLTQELMFASGYAWVTGCRAGRKVSLGVFTRWIDPGVPPETDLVGAVVRALLAGTRLIVVDDAHLLDDDSLKVVEQIVDDPSCRCLLTVTKGARWPQRVAELASRSDVVFVDVPDLSREAASELLEARLGGPVDSGTVSRLVELTRGTPGYLVAVCNQAMDTGTLRQVFGVWSVVGELSMPAQLHDVLEAQLASGGPETSAVIDYLAEVGRLPIDLLASLTSPHAVAATIEEGLVRTVGKNAELAHPMITAIRRASRGLAVSRRIRDALTKELSGPVISSRKLDADLDLASLALDDPHFPNRDHVLARGADIAARILDFPLALRCCRAVEHGPFRVASLLTEGYLHACRGDSRTADITLAQAQTVCGDPGVAEVATLLRVYSHVVAGDLGRAARVVSGSDDEPSPMACCAVLGFLSAARGFAAEARRLLLPLTDSDKMSEIAQMYRTMGMVIAAGDLGRSDEIVSAVALSEAQAGRWRLAQHQRLVMCCFEIHARYLVGDVEGVRRVARQSNRTIPARTGPGQSWLAAIAATSAWVSGERGTSIALLRSALDGLDSHGSSDFVWYPFAVDCAEAAAACGDVEMLREMVSRLRSADHGSFEYAGPRVALLDAWQLAHQGRMTAAYARAAGAADLAQRRGQPAQEVFCLQTALRFGDSSSAGRIADLARRMPNAPRAAAASAHARALANRDGPQLVAAAELYRTIGLHDCAADADAQAGMVFRRAGHAGLALSAQQRAFHSGAGLNTPAIAALRTRDGLTDRQREILALVEAGMANRAIAEALDLSVRTVEGHRYRAAIRVVHYSS